LAVCVAFGANSAKEAFERGSAAGNQGNFQEAIKHYTQAIRIDPNYANAYNNRAAAYTVLSDLKSAAKDAKKACELGDCNGLQYLEANNLLSN
ncbi:MAG: tetratricopeptide repeat protein, partial [Helicobacteraceae bacterium]|nr:tetratricopeptide repeat protein [Helicobacteraceae bacterium]